MKTGNRRLRGFTLIELMTVIAIVAVLLTLAIRAYLPSTCRLSRRYFEGQSVST